MAIGAVARHYGAAFATAALLATAAPAAAREEAAQPDPAEMGEAQAIIEVMFPTAKREEQMRGLLTEMTSQFAASIDMSRFEEPGIRAILEDYMADIPDQLMPLVSDHLPRMTRAMAIAYVNEFTLSELQDIRRFAETPSGSRYLSRSTALVGDPALAAVNTEYLGQVQALNRQLVSNLQQRLRDYVASHSGHATRQPDESR